MNATPLVGVDRYATAAKVAAALFTSPTEVGVASGEAFPDALAGGIAAAMAGGPLLIAEQASLPAATSDYLTANKSSIVTTDVFGGTTALDASVLTAISTALGV